MQVVLSSTGHGLEFTKRHLLLILTCNCFLNQADSFLIMAKRPLAQRHQECTQVPGERRSGIQLLFHGAKVTILTILTLADQKIIIIIIRNQAAFKCPSTLGEKNKVATCSCLYNTNNYSKSSSSLTNIQYITRKQISSTHIKILIKNLTYGVVRFRISNSFLAIARLLTLAIRFLLSSLSFNFCQ